MTSWRRVLSLPAPTRWAIAVWIALVLGVTVRVAVSRSTAQSVVPVYAMAGERWWNGEPLYDPPPPPLDVYRNPPGFAALFAPLSQLPIRLVAIAWRLVGLGLFAFGLRRFLAAVSPVSPRSAAAVWIIAAFLILPAFNNGQVNMLIAAGALHGATAAIRRQWWLASGWLMFAAWLKGYPIALAALFALLAPMRLGWRMPLVLAAALAWPYAIRNYDYVHEQTVEFWNITKLDERSQAPLERTMKGWTYLVRVTTGECVGRAPMKAVGAATGLLLAGIVLLAARRNGPTPELYARVLCLGLLWMVLFGPATESNTYSILAPIGWLFVGPKLPRRAKRIALLGIALLMLTELRGALPKSTEVTLASLQPAGALLLFGVAVWELLALRRPDPATASTSVYFTQTMIDFPAPARQISIPASTRARISHAPVHPQRR